MKIKTPFFYIKIDVLFIIVLFIFFLSKELRKILQYFFVCYLFIVFHELSHMLIASIFGRKVDCFNITLFGVNISFDKEHYIIKEKIINKKEYICNILIYLAGPISNFLLAVIFKNIRFVSDINIFLGILNLIPIYPLDGYNIIENVLKLFNSNIKNIKNIINVINYVFFVIFAFIGMITLVLFLNPSLILFLLYLIILKSSYSYSENSTKYYK